jgi:hypothetical protein
MRLADASARQIVPWRASGSRRVFAMTDLWIVALTALSFAITAGFVRLCERI